MNIRKWTLTTMLLAPVLLLSLTACTGTEPPSNAEGSSPSAATETADSTHAWNVKYVECLRAEGLAVSDPTLEEGFPALTGDEHLIQEAKNACNEKVGAQPGTQAVDKKGMEAKIRWGLYVAQCLRDAGYDIADPTEERALSLTAEVPEATFLKCDETSPRERE
jgi:hypothetical protein